MGFTEIRKTLITCLKTGSYDHEIREDMEDKNLLFSGKVTVEEVIDMALICRGGDHEERNHDDTKKKVKVHILAPKEKYKGWYIKFYYLDPHTIFISVHK